jgi:hypothetical protein
VIAALAGLVHDRQSATDYECNQDNDSCYGGSSLQPPFRAEPQVHKDHSSSSGHMLRGSAGGVERDKHLPSNASNFLRSVRERGD